MPAKKAGGQLSSPWKEFLTELDGMLGESLELHCIGGFARVYFYGFPRTTADIDYCSAVRRVSSGRFYVGSTDDFPRRILGRSEWELSFRRCGPFCGFSVDRPAANTRKLRSADNGAAALPKPILSPGDQDGFLVACRAVHSFLHNEEALCYVGSF